MNFLMSLIVASLSTSSSKGSTCVDPDNLELLFLFKEEYLFSYLVISFIVDTTPHIKEMFDDVIEHVLKYYIIHFMWTSSNNNI